MNKTFCCGDIHGNYKALKQVLEKSNFEYDNDTLITLGDIVDGWSDTYKCVEELLKIKNRIDIKGNHDGWFHEFLQHGIHPVKWSQGGYGTAKSYLREIGKEHLIHPKINGYVTALNPDDIPPEHQNFFKKQVLYYLDDKNRCFVHGGFNRHIAFKGQGENVYCWDRDLWMSALSFKDMPSQGKYREEKPYKFKMRENFDMVFIGHTSTINWNTTEPMKAANIINLDTGGGFDGKLTLMNVDDTSEYYQSDFGKILYPDEKGRN